MKNNNFLTALALCLGLSSATSFCSYYNPSGTQFQRYPKSKPPVYTNQQPVTYTNEPQQPTETYNSLYTSTNSKTTPESSTESSFFTSPYENTKKFFGKAGRGTAQYLSDWKSTLGNYLPNVTSSYQRAVGVLAGALWSIYLFMPRMTADELVKIFTDSTNKTGLFDNASLVHALIAATIALGGAARMADYADKHPNQK